LNPSTPIQGQVRPAPGRPAWRPRHWNHLARSACVERHPDGYCKCVSALRASHAPKYAALGRLLLKHRDATSLTGADDGRGEADSAATTEDAEELASELTRMGPTFVKLGQLLSTRADLLPPMYLEALAGLRDNVPPFPYDEAIRVVEDELGVKASRVFRSFNRRPIGSASLGQVHKARLKDGRLVAVKVRRPGVHEQVLSDMEVISELATFLDDHSERASRVGFGAMAEEFRRSLLDELDYNLEAENLQTLGALLSEYRRIVIPEPVTDLTTERILTMEFVPGRSVAAIPDADSADLDLPALSLELISAYLDQILVHGFLHADPHPGNVLVTEDGRLAILDLGMVVRLAPKVQEDLLRLVLAISNQDGTSATEALERLGTKLNEYDSDAMTVRVSDLLLRHSSGSIEQVAAGRLFGDLALAASSCGLRPRSELSMLARALLSLDEVARILDPSVHIDEVINDRAAHIMRGRMLQAARPTKVLSSALEAAAFAEALPGRLNKVLESLADGKLTLNLEGLDEGAIMRGAQKLANRVATGVLIAAFVVAAALFSSAKTTNTVWGYPVLTIVFLGLAVVTATSLGFAIMRTDSPPRRDRL
jgi:ubiquinone biosynthesis protein